MSTDNTQATDPTDDRFDDAAELSDDALEDVAGGQSEWSWNDDSDAIWQGNG